MIRKGLKATKCFKIWLPRRSLRQSCGVCMLVTGIFALSAVSQEPAAGSQSLRKNLPDDVEHAPEKLSRKRADAIVSEITESVTDRLPVPTNLVNDSDDSNDIVRRNLIDDHLFEAMKQNSIPHAALADDYTFLRRVSLDLTGRIPTREQVQQFVQNSAMDKREQVIDQLLASDAWVDRWAYWYGDLFRNCANRIGNATTENFDTWIRRSLRNDKPYNEMVTELLTATAPNSAWMPDAAPSAFLVRWHIPADSMYSDRYEDTADEIVIQSSKFFLGLNFQCISCHGGAGFLEKVDLGLSRKKREDLWAMAAFFGNTRVRIVPYQDRFTISEDGTGYDSNAASSVRLQRSGSPVVPTFFLTGQKADPNQPLRPQFAEMLTEHPQFARATANLFWKEFFGLGIVEPIDGFDLARQDPTNPPPAPWTVQPTNIELLDAIAKHFADNEFSLKSLMRLITRSSAYQLSSHFDSEWEVEYMPYFARHYPHMLNSEQLHDAIVEATGVFPDYQHKHLLYGTPLAPIRYWTQAATPENINDGEAKQLLRTFGQSNREWANPGQSGSILQAMMMMNSKFVTKRVSVINASYSQQMLESNLTPNEIVEAMYLRTLSRMPTAAETEIAGKWIEEDRQTGIEDLQWSLLNKLDFIFNY